MGTTGGKPWRIAGGRLLTPAPFLIAGIVNLSPDSFSGNGATAAEALRLARLHVSEGAHIVDIGAESTRPGAEDIGPKEEWRRLSAVLPAVAALRDAHGPEESDRTGFAISVDTWRSETAEAALAPLNTFFPDTSSPDTSSLDSSISGTSVCGADIINDISGGALDPRMTEVVADRKPGYVLGHCPVQPAVMQNEPRYGNVVDELLSWFSTRMNQLVRAGLPEDCICLDPCIGFAKNFEHNLAVIAAIPRFAALGRPLFFGISRKSLIGGITGLPVPERDTSTQVLTALLAREGVAIHRVHRTGDTVNTLKIVEALQEYASQ